MKPDYLSLFRKKVVSQLLKDSPSFLLSPVQDSGTVPPEPCMHELPKTVKFIKKNRLMMNEHIAREFQAGKYRERYHIIFLMPLYVYDWLIIVNYTDQKKPAMRAH